LWSMIKDGHFYEERAIDNIIEVTKEQIPA
jgi:hypothetical protein